jgi:beta-glucosidase
VAAANPRTAVLVNSGSPVLMPWADEVAAIMQIWFGGQSMSEAIADVLLGGAEPGGRLPVTLPRAEADGPVLDPRPADGVLDYSEGLLVGYRGFDRAGREPQFCFGHGLGYTDWDYESLHADTTLLAAGEDLGITVALRNRGARAGREIVQVYLEGSVERARPVRVLAAFAPVTAAPEAAVRARVTVPARAFARYDGERGGWHWPPGRYTVRVGRSSRDLRLGTDVTVS